MPTDLNLRHGPGELINGTCKEGSDRFGGLGGGCLYGASIAKRLENQVCVLIVTGENASHFIAPYLPTDYLKSLNKKSI